LKIRSIGAVEPQFAFPSKSYLKTPSAAGNRQWAAAVLGGGLCCGEAVANRNDKAQL